MKFNIQLKFHFNSLVKTFMGPQLVYELRGGDEDTWGLLKFIACYKF